jgi:hypothetical protein
MSSQSQRGAVSIVVVIIVGIVALGFGALWFTSHQEATTAKKAFADAQAKVVPTEARLAFAESGYGELAKMLGPKVPADLPKPENWARNDFGSATNSSFVNDPLLLGQKVDGVKAWLKGALEEVGEKDRAPANVQEAIEAMGNAYKRLQSDIKKTQDEVVKAKDAEIESLQKKLAEAEKKAADDLAALTTEKDNATARLNQQLTESNSQRDEAQAQNRKLTEEITSAKDTANKEVNAAKASERTLSAQVSALKATDKLQREKDTADGKVLAVNRGMKTAWIDVGGRDRIRRGSSFRVYEAVRAGQKIPKGRVVVTAVENDRSEVAIEREEGDGITEGDIIVSPVFDRSRATKFVFLGEPNGRLNKEAAKRVLEGLGAKVEDKVSVDTDFLVLGVKEAADAPELTESEAYKQAQAWGIEIIRARDLDPFLTL